MECVRQCSRPPDGFGRKVTMLWQRTLLQSPCGVQGEPECHHKNPRCLQRGVVRSVEPEVTKYESFFYHPDNDDTTYEPEEPQTEPDTDTPVSAGEWWVNFSTLGMLLSSGTCLVCICIAEYEKHT